MSFEELLPGFVAGDATWTFVFIAITWALTKATPKINWKEGGWNILITFTPFILALLVMVPMILFQQDPVWYDELKNCLHVGAYAMVVFKIGKVAIFDRDFFGKLVGKEEE